MRKKQFDVQSEIWLYPGQAGWHFITVPKEISEEIDFLYSMEKHGWGSLPVIVTLGKTAWKTSIFPDKKTSTYLLPLKAEVRKKEKLTVGDIVELQLEIQT